MDPRSPERGQYAFVQALIREVAYNTLSKKDRKARHLAAARYFESSGDGRGGRRLASHYLAAYRLAGAGPEAVALAAQARLALKGAAERAESLHSPDQAVSLLLDAVNIIARRKRTRRPAGQGSLTYGLDIGSSELASRYRRTGPRRSS